MPTSNGDGTSGLRERPIGEVAKDLTRDLSLLVRQELELAKSEMARKGRIAAPGLGMIGVAGVAGLMAAGALTAAAILVLAIFLSEWLAALIVGAVLAAAAYVVARQGKERVERAGSLLPEQTIETVKEDVEWAKNRATSART
jgi:hypothetical protein